MEPIIEVQDLKKYFPVSSGMISRGRGVLRAVDGVSFTIGKGESLALVGESGCGKTTTGRLLIRLIEPTSGVTKFEGVNIYELSKNEMRLLRRSIQIVFQDPFASLNPRKSIGQILSQPFQLQRLGSKNQLESDVIELLESVGLTPGQFFLDRYPHELSGGQRQRVVIARAISLKPKFIVADEPVSALDMSVRAQILNLIRDLKKKLSLTYLLITHDLATVRSVSEKIAVMYIGQIVEIGRVEDIFRTPVHPYTQALLAATPIPNPETSRTRKQIILKGDVPSPINPPSGCRFRTRCPIAISRCADPVPTIDLGNGHLVACIFAEEQGRHSIMTVS